MKFEKNYNKLGMTPHSQDQTWYTKEVARIGSIHVHNMADNRKWTCLVYVFVVTVTRADFETKEAAAAWGVETLKRMMRAAMHELETDVIIE